MIDLTITKENIAVATIDQPSSSANILNEDFFTELNKLLDSIEKTNGTKGLIFVSAKKKIFLAGADLVAMNANIDNEHWLNLVIESGQKTFNRIENLKIPTVAAIHGACLGGGLELALACDYRIASIDKCTKIGLPEVMLGILPAWGGSTRLPKLIGIVKSLSAILSGKQYTAKQAKNLGMIDESCLEQNLLQRAIGLCKSRKRKKRASFLIQSIILPIALIIAKRNIKKQTRGNYPAPFKIIKVISKGFFRGRDKSLQLEKEAFLELSKTNACKNLIRLFFLQEKARKSSEPTIDREPLDNVVVIGAGTMGAGITQWLSSRKKNVLLKDISERAVASGLKKIGKLFVSAVLKHKIDRPTVRGCLGKLLTSTKDVPLANKDIAIEAVVENFDLKTKVLKDVESKLPESSILATNTSALSITELSKHLKRPENFVGIHFFNPVHKMKLVEIVVGDNTSEETKNRAINFVQSIGKLPVVVKDSPGFLVNRILLPYLIEAVRLFSEGHSIESIDESMLDFGMPMGPLRLLDEIGLDVASHVALDLEQRLTKFSVPGILQDIIETDKLGKKSGQGFYIYRRGRVLGPNTAFNKLQSKSGSKNLGTPTERMIRSMTNEANKCIEEKVAESTSDIDFAMVMGTGWAPFRGGPIQYSLNK